MENDESKEIEGKIADMKGKLPVDQMVKKHEEFKKKMEEMMEVDPALLDKHMTI